jgi:hypothetical protein
MSKTGDKERGKNARIGYAKTAKDGAGGSYTWGKDTDVGEDEELDPRDPNFQSPDIQAPENQPTNSEKK